LWAAVAEMPQSEGVTNQSPSKGNRETAAIMDSEYE
jgi:hypothetical protein